MLCLHLGYTRGVKLVPEAVRIDPQMDQKQDGCVEKGSDFDSGFLYVFSGLSVGQQEHLRFLWNKVLINVRLLW